MPFDNPGSPPRRIAMALVETALALMIILIGHQMAICCLLRYFRSAYDLSWHEFLLLLVLFLCLFVKKMPTFMAILWLGGGVSLILHESAGWFFGFNHSLMRSVFLYGVALYIICAGYYKCRKIILDNRRLVAKAMRSGHLEEEQIIRQTKLNSRQVKKILRFLENRGYITFFEHKWLVVAFWDE